MSTARVTSIEAIRDWEERTGNRFPAAMAEWYASEGQMLYGPDLRRMWCVSLVDLWSEFSNEDQAYSLAELFGLTFEKVVGPTHKFFNALVRK